MSGQVVLITGASSGIGQCVAGQLAGTGFRVYGTSRTAGEPAGPAVDGAVTMIPMDVTSDESVQRAVELVVGREGRIDVLVNNAGDGVAGSVEDTSPEEVRTQFETNCFGVHRVSRAVLPVMRSQAGGRIVNVSSIAGLLGVPFQGVYSASKFAVEGLTEAMRLEVRPFGIHVSLVEPGDFRTGFTAQRRIAAAAADDSSAYRDNFRRALDTFEKEESGGADPDSIGTLIERIIRSRRPRSRYLVGPRSQTAGARAKRVLPYRVTEGIMSRYYKVK